MEIFGGEKCFLGNSFYMDDDSSNRASIYKFAKEIKILLNFRTMWGFFMCTSIRCRISVGLKKFATAAKSTVVASCAVVCVRRHQAKEMEKMVQKKFFVKTHEKNFFRENTRKIFFRENTLKMWVQFFSLPEKLYFYSSV